jgi:hypothetical protein
LHIVLFILYSLICGYGILRLPFFRNCGIRPGVLLLLFALHVLTGCLHNLIAWRFYPHHGDIWSYYENSIVMGHELWTDFHAFLMDNGTFDRFIHNSLISIHIILNLFSFQNLYINTLLFSFPVFLGTTALFRVFRRHFPGSILTALSVYLLPSALFWTSCIHREGALYMSLGFFFYSLDRLFAQSGSALAATSAQPASAPTGWRPLLVTTLWFLLIAYFRSAVALSLLPALAAWWWLSTASRALRQKTLLAAGALLLVVILLAGPLLLRILAHQQQSFQVLEGHSRIDLPILDGSLTSLLHTLPAALLNGWLEPLPGAGGQKIYTVFSLELLLIWGLAVFTLLRRLTSPKPQMTAPSPEIAAASTPNPAPDFAAPWNHFAVCCILFALIGMLLVGLIVPFVGAIVRYRSIYLPFLLAPFLHYLCTTLLRRFDQRITPLIS